MAPPSRILALSTAVFGGIVLSQAPEFTQQYRQRIGGAIDELSRIVETFDRQAADNKLGRVQALNTYAQSGEPFLKAQGASLRETIDRFDGLRAQQQMLNDTPAAIKPFVLFQSRDGMIFANTWRDFIPAVPVSMAGLLWSGIGFLCGWLVMHAVSVTSRRTYRTLKGSGRSANAGRPI